MPLKVRSGYGPQVRRQNIPGIYLQPNIPEGAFGGGLGQALSNLGAAIEAKQAKTSDFEARKAYIDETTRVQSLLSDEMLKAPIGAPGFANSIVERLDVEQAEIVNNLKAQGLSDAQIQETQLRFADLRSKAHAKALDFEEKSGLAKAELDVTTSGENLAKIVLSSPDEVDSALGQLRALVDNLPQADAIQKEKLYQDQAARIRIAAAYGAIKDDPKKSYDFLMGKGGAGSVNFEWRSRDRMEYEKIDRTDARLGKVSSDLIDRVASGYSRLGLFNIKINSGYRDAATNEAVGGAEKSQHLTGNALDLDVSELSTQERIELIGSMSAAGVKGIGVYANSIHVDMGGRRSWGPDYTSGSVPVWAQPIIGQHLTGKITTVGTEDSFVRAMKVSTPTVESAGEADPYRAESRVITRSGDRAYGKYQVMGENIPSWTKVAIGRSVTVQEFLDTPSIQEAVFEDQMRKNYRKYGNVRDAASVWFTGVPYDTAVRQGRSDGGLTVQQYVAKIETALGNGTGSAVFDNLTADEQIRMLGVARTELNQQQVGLRGALDLDESNATAAFMSGLPYQGNMPTQRRYLDAYGEEDGEQKWRAFQDAAAVGDFISDMKSLSADEIQTELKELEPIDTSSKTFAVDLKAFETAQTAAKAVLTARTADSAGYVIQNYPGVAGAFSKAEAENSSVARQVAFTQLAKAYDQLGISESDRRAFSDGLLTKVRDNFASMTPEAKITALVNMKRETGDLFYAGLEQMEKAGMRHEAYLAGLVDASPESQLVAANALRGLEIIKEDESRRPNGEAINAEFLALMGASSRFIPAETAGTINDLATALYVFEGGRPGKGADPTLDLELYDKAVRRLLGGEGGEDTGIVNLDNSFAGYSDEYANLKTILPPGTTKDEFENWMQTATPEVYERLGGAPKYSDGTRASPEELADEGIFVRVGAQEYTIIMPSDGQPLQNEEGERYIIPITTADIKEAPVNFILPETTVQGHSLPETKELMVETFRKSLETSGISGDRLEKMVEDYRKKVE